MKKKIFLAVWIGCCLVASQAYAQNSTKLSTYWPSIANLSALNLQPREAAPDACQTTDGIFWLDTTGMVHICYDGKDTWKTRAWTYNIDDPANPLLYTTDTSAKVGIGTTTPSAKLHVYDDDDATVLFQGVINAGASLVSFGGKPTLVFYPQKTGALVVGYNAVDFVPGDYSFTSGYNSQATEVGAIAMGATNIASEQFSTAVGGSTNTASGLASAVLGGQTNSATNSYSVVAGGTNNQATGLNAGVLAGDDNIASGTHSVITGGHNNTVSGTNSAIIGGVDVTLSGDNSVALGVSSGGAVNLTADDTTYILTDMVAVNKQVAEYPLDVTGEIRFRQDDFAVGSYAETSYTSFGRVDINGNKLSGSTDDFNSARTGAGTYQITWTNVCFNPTPIVSATPRRGTGTALTAKINGVTSTTATIVTSVGVNVDSDFDFIAMGKRVECP
ncbi:MAG: hypothetical protein Q7S13_04715 [Candidatus Omnitrophota bacterium]|nr:hypothetical protein [Candidatus Omnitrophota bacterium]